MLVSISPCKQVKIWFFTSTMHPWSDRHHRPTQCSKMSLNPTSHIHVYLPPNPEPHSYCIWIVCWLDPGNAPFSDSTLSDEKYQKQNLILHLSKLIVTVLVNPQTQANNILKEQVHEIGAMLHLQSQIHCLCKFLQVQLLDQNET